MNLRLLVAVLALLVIGRASAGAADTAPLKIGVLFAFTTSGSSSNGGPELDAAIATYQKEHGDTVDGHKIVLIRRDTTGPNEEVVQRLAQELIVNDNVDMIMGLSFSPDAITLGPISTRAKKPVFIVNSATDNVMANAPYMARFAYTNGQASYALARWAHSQGYRKIFNFYSDYVTGADAAKTFTKFYESDGISKVVGEAKPPLLSKDFAPYLLHVRDSDADAMFIFLGASENNALFLREYHDLGLDKRGIKIIAVGSMVEDDVLDAEGDPAIGLVSAYNYSSVLQNPANKMFQRDFAVATGGKVRANYAAYGAYDVLNAIYTIAKLQGGHLDPDKTMQLVRGMSFQSPRGPITIDAQTRDMVSNIYLRRVERRGDHLVNVVIGTIPMVKNPNETYTTP
jgi:branched-chain amino acid transport system substrate-binding protein